MYIRFTDQPALPGKVKPIKDGVVKVTVDGTVADDLAGFMVYRDEKCTMLIGNYSEYTTRYKESDTGLYLSTGEVYVAPPEPEPKPEQEPEPEPTPEEIAEREKQEKIANLQMQIEAKKAELSSTDYIYTKETEYGTVEKSLGEYDWITLHEERQALRDEINALEKELEELEEGGGHE